VHGYARNGGGAEGTRTPDPLIANEVLSQLSYSPVPQGADNAQRPWRKSSGARRSQGNRVDGDFPVIASGAKQSRSSMSLLTEIAAHAHGLDPRVASLLAMTGKRHSPVRRSCRLRTESPTASFWRPLGERSVIDILFELAFYVINLFKWAVILAAIFSLLTAFGVLDTRNRIVWTIGDFLYRVTEPVLRPIRNMLPNLGGIDLSPWIVVVLIQIAILPLLFKLHTAITFGAWQPLVL
jgi:YggT family protein